MEGNKGQTVFLSVIGIATLLVAIVGATFAWFSATITGNDTASSVIVNTATLGITYENGTELKLENAIPGDLSNTVTFTVKTNTDTTVDQKYKINFIVNANTFTNKEDLVYTLTSTADKTGTPVAAQTDVQVPATTSQIGEIATLKAGETHTYTMQVKFKETESNQNANQGVQFNGKIEVVTENVSAA